MSWLQYSSLNVRLYVAKQTDFKTHAILNEEKGSHCAKTRHAEGQTSYDHFKCQES